MTELVMKSDDVVTVQEAAKRLGVSRMTIYRWTQSGRLNHVVFAGIVYIPVSDIECLKAE